jgi:hypothetical protein
MWWRPGRKNSKRGLAEQSPMDNGQWTMDNGQLSGVYRKIFCCYFPQFVVESISKFAKKERSG